MIGIGDSGFGIRAHTESEETLDATPQPGAVLVLCLGNDLLRDDGVGWAVADVLEECLPQSRPVTIRRSALSGFYLLDELTGWEDVVVVDAVRTGAHPPGTVHSFPFEALGTEAGPSPHAVGLPTVVTLGRRSGVPLPRRIRIVAIEVEDMETVCEGLTPRVQAAVPDAAELVRALVTPAAVPAGAPA